MTDSFLLIGNFNPINLNCLKIFLNLSKIAKTYLFIDTSLSNYRQIETYINLIKTDSTYSNLEFIEGKKDDLLSFDGKIILLEKDETNYIGINYLPCKYDCNEFKLSNDCLEVNFPYFDSNQILTGKNLYTHIEVINYIVSYRLYFAKTLSSKLSKMRYIHCFNIANLAYKIAKLNNLDPIKAYMCGLYHDFTRSSCEFIKYRPLIDAKYSKYYKGYLPSEMYHQFTAEFALKEYFDVSDEEIYLAIRYHTSGNQNMSKYAKLIYALDKIEPTRSYDSSMMYINLVNDLESGFKGVLKANKEYLDQHNIDQDNYFTNLCYKQYLSN